MDAQKAFYRGLQKQQLLLLTTTPHAPYAAAHPQQTA
jgi:hypothetical protein